MSKKIIAILAAITILFVCVFAACEKKEKEELYADADKYEFVTDGNGNRVLSEDGRFVVYATDEEGKYVTDENGENVTGVRQFEPIFDGDVLEEYGFKLKIPSKWKFKEEGNILENRKGHKIKFFIDKLSYEEYYERVEVLYGKMIKNEQATLEENVSKVKGVEKDFRLIINAPEETYITVIMINAGNAYNFTLSAPAGEAKVEELDELLSGLEFKPYTYYPELTTESTENISDTETTTNK